MTAVESARRQREEERSQVVLDGAVGAFESRVAPKTLLNGAIVDTQAEADISRGPSRGSVENGGG